MENSQPSGSNVTGNASAPSESTVARSFADDLDSMFGLSSGGGGGAGVDVLSQNVEEKKKDVSTGQSELEQLEAKLRETEQRLARVSRQSSPSRQAATSGATTGGATSGAAMGGATSTSTTNNTALRGDGEQRQPHPLAQKPTYPADRPPTAPRQDTQQLMQGMPGAMPGTPQGADGGRDDYVMVDDGRGR